MLTKAAFIWQKYSTNSNIVKYSKVESNEWYLLALL